MRVKHRVAVVNEETSEERLQMRLSLMNLVLVFVALMVVSFGLFALMIWATPLRNYLPGYNENIKRELVAESYRLDSLQHELDMQGAYLSSIRDVVSGNVHSDSVSSLDSMTVQEKQALLTERSQVLDEFVADYEAREHDNLLLFDPSSAHPVTTLYRPVQGVIVEPFDRLAGHYGVDILTTSGASVSSTLTGTIVFETYVASEGWVLMVQHDADYLSIYNGLLMPFKHVGAGVQACETLGMVADEMVRFQLWQRGQPLNPEEVISF